MNIKKFFEPERSVRDLEIVDILDRKTFNVKESKLKKNTYHKYFSGEYIGVSKVKNKPSIAFQEVLLHYSLDEFDHKKKSKLIIVSSIIERTQTTEEKQNQREKNRISINKKVKELKIFYGSTHKPLSQNYYGELTIPLEALDQQNPNYSNFRKKLSFLLKMFSKINNSIYIIADKTGKNYLNGVIPNIYTQTEDKDLKDLIQNVVFETDKNIKKIFNNLHIYKSTPINSILYLALTLIIFSSLYFTFAYTENTDQDITKEYEQEISYLQRNLNSQNKEIKSLQKDIKIIQDSLKSSTKFYKPGRDQL